MTCYIKNCPIYNIGTRSNCIGFWGWVLVRRIKRITNGIGVSFLAIVLKWFNLDQNKLWEKNLYMHMFWIQNKKDKFFWV
jgi:hypothetical protein